MNVRILIADDNDIARGIIRAAFRYWKKIEIVGDAEFGDTTVVMTFRLRPDIILMDVEMDDFDGIYTTRRICRLLPEINVIGVSVHTEREVAVQMLAAGARGYVVKNENLCVQLRNAVRAVCAGVKYIGDGVQDLPEGRLHKDECWRRFDISPLSGGERDVLQCAAIGLSARDSAERLYLSRSTVETYRKRIKEKIGLFNNASTIKHAINEGLTSPIPKRRSTNGAEQGV